MSTHRIDVVRIPPMERHPNADSLSLIKLWGYTVILRTDQWHEGDLAVYIPPDYVVPETPEYEFLRTPDGIFHSRIRVRRFRGLLSQGLLMPAPEGVAEGDDVMERLGIVRYVSPEDLQPGAFDEPEVKWAPVFDVEDGRRYHQVFTPGEDIVILEKLHGKNTRAMWAEGRLRVGSRTKWKNPETDTEFWPVVRRNPWIEEYCQRHPEDILFMEMFGWVQELKYGAKGPADVWLCAFDVMRGNEYLPFMLLPTNGPGHLVPVLYVGPYDPAVVASYVDGPSMIPGAKHMREGIVVRPRLIERNAPEVGRVIAKYVSDAYMEKAKD